jgi:ornithine cyclodeaminase/alanine dehydrogenase
MDGILYLSETAIRETGIGAVEVMEAIEAALQHPAPESARTAASTSLDGGTGTRFVAKAGCLAAPAFGAVKWFGLNPRNREAGLPDYDPLILLNEGRSGRPVAILAARWITGIRTAALSATAARRLAHAAAESVAFVGCGDQARHHLEILRKLFPLSRVSAFSRTSTSAQAFCAEACRAGLICEVAQSAREAVSDAAIVVTTVPQGSPMDFRLRGEWTRPGAFVAMVDRGFSWDPSSLAAFALALTDDVLLSGPGAPEHVVWSEGIAFDLADLLNGRLQSLGGADRTAFAFSGTALADVAAAVLIYERAVACGLGDRLRR